MDFKDKCVTITGGATGKGLAIGGSASISIRHVMLGYAERKRLDKS